VKIEEIRIDEISNHERNPKQHPDKQIRLLEESIKRFGWTNPVILSADNIILAGHARVKAAIELGQDTIPCIRTKLSGAEADAYLLTDNRLSDIAPYDRDILAELLSDIPSDLAEITGFDQVQVDALLSGEDVPDIEKFISDSQPEEPREEVDAEPQIDRAAELNEIWQVKTGDMWQLGDHRLICGDCTDPAVIMRLMQGEKADTVFTDPPYNVGRKYTDMTNDNQTPEEYAKWTHLWLDAMFNHALSADADVFITPGVRYMHQTESVLRAYGSIVWCIAWIKRNSMMRSPTGFSTWEPILWIKNGEPVGYGNKRYDTLDIPMYLDQSAKGHPTPKPVKLIEELFKIKGDSIKNVFDAFNGSGSTMIACENTGRKLFGIEIAPEYVAVCLQRFKDATGKEPVRING